MTAKIFERKGIPYLNQRNCLSLKLELFSKNHYSCEVWFVGQQLFYKFERNGNEYFTSNKSKNFKLQRNFLS